MATGPPSSTLHLVMIRRGLSFVYQRTRSKCALKRKLTLVQSLLRSNMISTSSSRAGSFQESPFSMGTTTKSSSLTKQTKKKNKKRKPSRKSSIKSKQGKVSTTPTSVKSSTIHSESTAIDHGASDIAKKPSKSFLTPYPKPLAPLLPRESSSDSSFSLKMNPLEASYTRSTFNMRLSHSSVPRHGTVGNRIRRSFPRQEHTDSSSSPSSYTIEELARDISKLKFKKIVIMSGAGVSTNSGIPDFRTPGTGLYDNLEQYHIPEPSAIFDITYFARNPRPFFTLAKELYPGKYSPNMAHYFIRLLQDKDLLLRNYTQNIDGLERLAGIKSSKLVEAHGSFSSASCTRCRTKHDPDSIRTAICDGRIPYCRSKYCNGVVKPDIVFFGEDLPQRFHSMRHVDLLHCDLLFVMGTSLEVEPFASLVTLARYDVPRVLINREVVGPFRRQRKRERDLVLTGDLVQQVKDLVKLVGWENDLKKLTHDADAITSGTSNDQSEESVDPMMSTDTITGDMLTEDLSRLSIKDDKGKGKT